LTALIGKGIYDVVKNGKNGENGDGSKRRFFNNVNHEDVDTDESRRAGRVSMRSITDAIQRRDGTESV
jgi:hypothetical protein